MWPDWMPKPREELGLLSGWGFPIEARQAEGQIYHDRDTDTLWIKCDKGWTMVSISGTGLPPHMHADQQRGLQMEMWANYQVWSEVLGSAT